MSNMKKRDVNIFRTLDNIRSAWAVIENQKNFCLSIGNTEALLESQKDFFIDGSDVRERFLTEFEDFLFSCEWTNSRVVKEIVGYIQSGTPLCQIADLVDLKESAFRMRIVRMTNTINDLLFDGKPCPDGIYLLRDADALKKCLIKIRLLQNAVDVNKEFSLWQLGYMKSHIGESDSFCAGRENLDKYFQSVLFLALTSRSFAMKLLGDIDPSALGYAYNDLRSDELNSTKLLFSLLLRRLTSASVACRDELAAAKREYRDYVQEQPSVV